MNSKRCYVLFCDEEYYYLTRNVLTLLDKFSEHKVLVYTINFLPTDSFKNVAWKRVNDYNLLEYQTTGKNDLIKNDWDKTMYSCFMKASAIAKSLETDFDEFVYLDVDTFPTKKIDDIFLEVEQRDLPYPILPKFFEQFMMFGGKGNPFQETFDESKTLEWWLIERLGLKKEDYQRKWYRQSCFFYYNKNSKPFWEETSGILSDEDIFRNQNEFFGDESVINVLLWKYNVTECFGAEHIIHIAGGNMIDSTDKIDNLYKELNTDSGPKIVTNWYGNTHFDKAWMLHGKIFKRNWKENLLSTDQSKAVWNEEDTRKLNNYFVDKMLSLN
jgi:hypothetical protein